MPGSLKSSSANSNAQPGFRAPGLGNKLLLSHKQQSLAEWEEGEWEAGRQHGASPPAQVPEGGGSEGWHSPLGLEAGASLLRAGLGHQEPLEKPLDQQGMAEASLETAEYYSQATGPTAYISCPRGKGLVIPDSRLQRGRELRRAALWQEEGLPEPRWDRPPGRTGEGTWGRSGRRRC